MILASEADATPPTRAQPEAAVLEDTVVTYGDLYLKRYGSYCALSRLDTYYDKCAYIAGNLTHAGAIPEAHGQGWRVTNY